MELVDAELMLEEFQAKHGFSKANTIASRYGPDLMHLGSTLNLLSDMCLMKAKDSKDAVDPAMLRMHLILEELSELAVGLGASNTEMVADALADLMYVVVGTAVTYDLPLGALFLEVHRSNMTKAVRDPDDTRLRDKGNTYQPPDIAGVLRMAGKCE